MSADINVAIYYANQCNKRKCTSVHLLKYKEKLPFKLHWLNKPTQIRNNSIVLTPNTSEVLLTTDVSRLITKGITLLDCSWNRGQLYLEKWRFPYGKKLPPLLAGNPVNYGKWYKLSSVEALAASLILMHKSEEAHDILDLFSWGKSFYELNQQLLEAYGKAKDQNAINEIFHEFFP